MNDHEKPGGLDEAIDEAVREMMQVDAPAGLRFRVARTISPPAPARQGFRLGLAALGLTLVVLSLMWRPTAPVTSVDAPRAAGAMRAGSPPQPAVPQAVEATADESAPGLVPARSRRRTVRTPDSIFGPQRDRVAAASIPWAPAAPVDLDARPGPAQDDVWRSAIAPIMLEPIRVAPLAIQPLFAGTLPPPR